MTNKEILDDIFENIFEEIETIKLKKILIKK